MIHNVLIFGQIKSGKTAFIVRLSDYQFIETSDNIKDTDILQVSFLTNKDRIDFHFWNISHQDFYESEFYYRIPMKAAIIMLDVTTNNCLEYLKVWVNDILRLIGDIPIVICFNKIDSKNRKIKSKEI